MQENTFSKDIIFQYSIQWYIESYLPRIIKNIDPKNMFYLGLGFNDIQNIISNPELIRESKPDLYFNTSYINTIHALLYTKKVFNIFPEICDEEFLQSNYSIQHFSNLKNKIIDLYLSIDGKNVWKQCEDNKDYYILINDDLLNLIED
tara:strand:+ start:2922 stop:3365 length:444 start_codon:yes stop_codon:yes gene_type:complete